MHGLGASCGWWVWRWGRCGEFKGPGGVPFARRKAELTEPSAGGQRPRKWQDKKWCAPIRPLQAITVLQYLPVCTHSPCTEQPEWEEHGCEQTQVTSSTPPTIRYEMYESELQMPDIMQLMKTALSEPYSIYTYRYFIHNWPQLCIMARAGLDMVGAIVCKLEMHHFRTRRGYIAMLAVHRHYRKRRIGEDMSGCVSWGFSGSRMSLTC